MPQSHKLEGFVYNAAGNPQADRVVRAYRRDYGTLIGEATTGNGNIVPADEHYNNVSLLLPFDGLHGETTTTDLSPTPKTVTFNGNAALSNVQKKFGETSLYLDGSGDYLTLPTSDDLNFGVGDFTIEAWINLNSISDSTIFCGTGNITMPSTSFLSCIIVGGVMGFVCGVTSNGNPQYLVQGTTTILPNTWHHVAFVKKNGSIFALLDGVLDTNVISTTLHNHTTSNGCLIGIRKIGGADYGSFNGYMDDIRITKGYARYTADFTPPAQTHPSTEYGGNALGKFTIPTNFTGETYVVVLPHETEVTNMKVKDRVVPVAV